MIKMTRYTNEAHSDRQFWYLFYKEKESYTKKRIKWKSQGKILFNGYPIDDEKGQVKRDRNDPKEILGMPIIRIYDRIISIDEMNDYLSKSYFVKRDTYKNKTYIAKKVWL